MALNKTFITILSIFIFLITLTLILGSGLFSTTNIAGSKNVLSVSTICDTPNSCSDYFLKQGVNQEAVHNASYQCINNNICEVTWYE